MTEKHLKLIKGGAERISAIEPKHKIKVQFGDRTVFLTGDNTIFRAS